MKDKEMKITSMQMAIALLRDGRDIETISKETGYSVQTLQTLRYRWNNLHPEDKIETWGTHERKPTATVKGTRITRRYK